RGTRPMAQFMAQFMVQLRLSAADAAADSGGGAAADFRGRRGGDSAAGPGWRAPPALAALRFAAGCPRRRTSRGRRCKLGAARLKHASPWFPRDALHLGAREVGVRHPGPATLRGGMTGRLGALGGSCLVRVWYGAGIC